MIDTTSETSFWESIQRSGRRGKEEGGAHTCSSLGHLATPEQLFNGRVVSTDGVAYVVEGFVAAWSSRPGDCGGLL